jgi:hypothetical protein
VQQAPTCLSKMCVEHCSDNAVRQHRLYGKPLKSCPSGRHQHAADHKHEYGALPSTSPRRTRSGPASSSTRLDTPDTMPAPSANTLIPTLPTAHPRIAPHPSSELTARSGLAMPFALPVDSNQQNMYEASAPSKKQRRELEAQSRSRAQRDVLSVDSSYTVWYWTTPVSITSNYY